MEQAARLTTYWQRQATTWEMEQHEVNAPMFLRAKNFIIDERRRNGPRLDEFGSFVTSGDWWKCQG